jgi:hypothetical protein
MAGALEFPVVALQLPELHYSSGAGIAAPALMSYGATAALVLDAVEAARALAGPALEAAGESLHDRYAA